MVMTLRHEHIIGENPPRPKQLMQLANISIRSAAMRNQLRSPERLEGHYCFDEIEALNTDNPQNETGRIRHRVAVRVGKQAAAMYRGQKIWSLKYFNRYFVEQNPGKWISASTTYQFEWTRKQALLARRTLRVIDEANPSEEWTLENWSGDITIAPDMAEAWHMQSQYEQMTQDDVEMQIEELGAYYDKVADLGRRMTG